MFPKPEELNMVYLELSSRRKLIGRVFPSVYDTIFSGAGILPEWIDLYYPVEAHIHILVDSEGRFKSASKDDTGEGSPMLRSMMGARAPLVRVQASTIEVAIPYNETHDHAVMSAYETALELGKQNAKSIDKAHTPPKMPSQG